MGRSPCCDKGNVKRGPWSPEEDATLKSYVETHGIGGSWIALPKKAGLRRCGKSCRLRWLNYLRPDIKHGGFTEEEDNIICRLYCEIGSRCCYVKSERKIKLVMMEKERPREMISGVWSVIASNLPGRTDNDVKNYWNTKLKKKILSGKIKLLTPNNFVHPDSKDSIATAPPGLNDMPKPKIHSENHEFSTSDCHIPASFTLNVHQVPMEDPVYHRSKFGGGGNCNFDQHGSLLDIISSSSTSTISNNSSNSCLSVDNNSAISFGYGNNNTGVDMVDLGFGFEFPMDDVANNNGGFLLERSLSSAYGNYSQSCNYPGFADEASGDKSRVQPTDY